MVRGYRITELERFSFKLAGHLGMTVSELEETMTAREFYQWIEYAEIEPLLSDRMEIMLAQLTSLMYNVNSKKAKGTMEFLISFSEDDKKLHKQKKTESDLKEFLRGKDGSR